jgi:hypothetical protein
MRRTIKESTIINRQLNISIKKELRQLVVPKSLIDKIIWIMHDQMGHPGRNRTVETMKLKFYWSGMSAAVQLACRNCHYCCKRKANNIVAKVPIMKYAFDERPNSRVHMDLTGPFNLAKSGYYYILLLKCALTKWLTLIPVITKDMEHIQQEYIDKFTGHFGAPLMLITDQGTEFHNLLARQLAELWGVRKVVITPRNPRSDGQAENAMRTVKDMLQAFTNENQDDWDEKLSAVAQAHNNTINDATGMTPYFLVHGVEMTMPSQEHIEELNVDDFHSTVLKQKEAMEWCWKYAAERCSVNADVGAKSIIPNERLEFVPYEVGDFFYNKVVARRFAKNTSKKANSKIALSTKLQFRYVGPYMIKEVLSPIIYKAIIHNKEKVVHALNMKPMLRTRKMKEYKGKRVGDEKVIK